MSTHSNIVANLHQMSAFLADDSFPDVLLLVLPLFHFFGLVIILAHGLHRKGTVVIQPKFDFEVLLQIIQTYKVTFAHLVPPIVIALAKVGSFFGHGAA